MGLAEIQGALARLCVDPALRDRFFDDPAAVGAELGLVAGEAQGLACVSQRQVEQYAASLRCKRRDQVRRFIPTAARALGTQYAEFFEEYAEHSEPRGSKADLDDAIGFVDTLRRTYNRIEPEWAVELARYELAWHQAARSSRLPLVRIFRFSFARRELVETIAPRATVTLWWRPTRRARVRHFVIGMPSINGFGWLRRGNKCRTGEH
jgi:hypothetical protein